MIFLLQHVKVKEYILRPIILVKIKPTDTFCRTIVAVSPGEESPNKVSSVMLETVIFVSRVWSPGRNIIVVLEEKYISASRAYSESVVQLVEF